MIKNIISCIFLFTFFPFCNPANDKKQKSEVEINQTAQLQKKFYGMVRADSVFQYTLTNSNGMTVMLINYGATLTNIFVPDKNGKPGDVVLGLDSLSGYLQTGNPYFGCIVGRYGNRIAHAKFILDGKTYQLNANDHENTLHGGLKGFDKAVWTVNEAGSNSIMLEYKSKDGEEGYPGNLTVQVTYTVTDQNELKIHYTATTDKATPVNLTSHSYFNLSAGNDSTILNHILMLNADYYTAVNDQLIPTGNLPSVKGTPMDFTSPKKIGNDIAKIKGGYDQNWVLNGKGDSMELAATVYEPNSGRFMQVYTTQPGIQFYTGNFLDGSLTGKYGRKYQQHGALCLETQHFPDSPNQPSFPNTILKPGETYNQTTIYKFSIK